MIALSRRMRSLSPRSFARSKFSWINSRSMRWVTCIPRSDFPDSILGTDLDDRWSRRRVTMVRRHFEQWPQFSFGLFQQTMSESKICCSCAHARILSTLPWPAPSWIICVAPFDQSGPSTDANLPPRAPGTCGLTVCTHAHTQEQELSCRDTNRMSSCVIACVALVG